MKSASTCITDMSHAEMKHSAGEKPALRDGMRMHVAE